MARSKRTPEAAERIIRAIRLGATNRLAAAAGGINVATFYRWLDADRAFRDAVKEAEGAAALAALAAIERAAQAGTWQAAAWLLERRYPEEYGRRVVTQQLGGIEGGPIRIEAYDYRAAAATLGGGETGESADPLDDPPEAA